MEGSVVSGKPSRKGGAFPPLGWAISLAVGPRSAAPRWRWKHREVVWGHDRHRRSQARRGGPGGIIARFAGKQSQARRSPTCRACWLLGMGPQDGSYDLVR